jgi:hypothetical protein
MNATLYNLCNTCFQSKNAKGAESVKVVVRCRPMNEKETKDGHERYARLMCFLI